MVSINHISISLISLFISLKLFNNIEISFLRKKLIPLIIIINELTFIMYLLLTKKFHLEQHLPLDMCYLNNLIIMFCLYKNIYHPYLHFSSIFCGICGLINHNLASYDLIIYGHFIISHTILILYFIFTFKIYKNLNLKDFFKSIQFTTILLLIIFILNLIIGSNYWFMFKKPDGVNLTILFPDWPLYFFILLIIGFLTYSTVYLINKRIYKIYFNTH